MESFLSVASQAARSAGALIRENWRQAKQVHYKSAINLVTTIDRRAEEMIVGLLLKNFPGHSVLAEEETSISGSEGGYRWIIDPLDGTTNFVHAYPQFGVSIGLEQAGEIILGVVYDPLREEEFTAVKGQGARLNGQPVHTTEVAELNKALLATGFPYDHRENPDYYLRYFRAFMVRAQGIRRAGAAALDLCYLACGRIDGFWELKLHPWDTAAGSLIVREAGGTVTDFAGKPFSILGEETLASNGLIHAEMLDALKLMGV
ncbi:MAG: inositol monophosphatase [Deltaproteobacteria bacterium RIFCSPLOWO2_12_FULL_60_19]|nr:MAG: inositol monophosphatase [Deltaproteobacteria bacterium RIFCSPLOWO2_12_FULL_60_19]